MTDEQIELGTPNVALSFLRPGNYRVEVNERGRRHGRQGQRRRGGSNPSRTRASSCATSRSPLSAAAGNSRRSSTCSGAPDEFDSWNLERDRRHYLATPSQTIQYVSPDVTGYEDLDEYGSWSSEAEYGYVWTPSRVGADWSPYRYGRWVWVRPWGWTWIDDAPWGYAPFHYGRWAHVRNRWCWVPGPRHVRAVYAPALVGWVGTPRVSYSGSFAGVAWFPLGPREVYVPGRRFSPRYVERVNVTNSMIVSRTVREVYENRARNVTYRNRAVPGAVTAVSRATFTSAAARRRSPRARQRAGHHARAGATAAAPQIEPVRESRLGTSDAARRNVRVPPRAVVTRQVIVKRAPPASAAVATPREQVDRSHRPQATPATQRPARSDKPQIDEIVRRTRQSPQEDRTQQHQQQVRQLQEREQQQQRQRQAESQQRQQRNSSTTSGRAPATATARAPTAAAGA